MFARLVDVDQALQLRKLFPYSLKHLNMLLIPHQHLGARKVEDMINLGFSELLVDGNEGNSRAGGRQVGH